MVNKTAKVVFLEMRSPTREHFAYGKICFKYFTVTSKRQIADRCKIEEIIVALMFRLDFIVCMLELFILHLKLNLVNCEFKHQTMQICSRDC